MLKEPSVLYKTLVFVFSGVFLLLCAVYYFIASGVGVIFNHTALYAFCIKNAFIFTAVLSFFSAVYFSLFIILLLLLAKAGKEWWTSIIFSALYFLFTVPVGLYLIIKKYLETNYVQVSVPFPVAIPEPRDNYAFIISLMQLAVGFFGTVAFVMLIIMFNRPKKSVTGEIIFTSEDEK